MLFVFTCRVGKGIFGISAFLFIPAVGSVTVYCLLAGCAAFLEISMYCGVSHTVPSSEL
jgi:hypothetical protein